jgi:hypothetical protein
MSNRRRLRDRRPGDGGLEFEQLLIEHPTTRQRVLYVLPKIPEAAPPAVREGVARRRLTVIAGRCPCGAEISLPDVAGGTVADVKVWHEDDCPAGDQLLLPLVRRWLAS